MSFRVVRFMLDTGEYETLVCSTLPQFTLSDLKELYHARWGIECSFRFLKYSIGLCNLKGRNILKFKIYNLTQTSHIKNGIRTWWCGKFELLYFIFVA